MLKKIIISILLLFGFIIFTDVTLEARNFFGNSGKENIYKDAQIGLEEGIDQVAKTVDVIETEQTASEYIQSLVVYILSFLSVIAVIYIIYAGIMIMISGGDDEKLKSQKKTIISVIIGIVVIWLAYSIVLTVSNMLNNKNTGTGGGTEYEQASD